MKNIKEKEKNISEIVKNISEIMRVLPKLVNEVRRVTMPICIAVAFVLYAP